MQDVLRPDKAELLAAVDALRERVQRRKEANFSLWLALKRASAGLPEGTTRFTLSNADVSDLCDDFFAMYPASGKIWYLPFSTRSFPSEGKENGGWPRSTVWRGIGDGRFVFPNLYSIADRQKRKGVADFDILSTYDRAVPQVLTDFSANGHKVPLEPLAVWRYRHGAPEGVATTAGLSAHLIRELGLTDTELTAFFE